MRSDAYLNGQDVLNFYKSDKLKFTKSGFPIVSALEDLDITDFDTKPFNYALSSKEKDYYIHFYIQDYMFNRIWNTPDRYVETLKEYKGIIQPDFSLYYDMPKPLQIFNVYRNNWFAAYCQSAGIKVIPSVVWSDEDSYEFCFEGMPKNSFICVSSIGAYKAAYSRKLFFSGLEKCIEVLQPKHILLRSAVHSIYDIDNFIKEHIDIPVTHIDYKN